MAIYTNQKPICELSEKEWNSLPGFGAAQLLNKISNEYLIDVARYGKNKIVVFIYDDGKEQFWQPYFIKLTEQ